MFISSIYRFQFGLYQFVFQGVTVSVGVYSKGSEKIFLRVLLFWIGLQWFLIICLSFCIITKGCGKGYFAWFCFFWFIPK